ncbi:MAG TPA: hypothetical protein VGD78_11680 [Chthoniobacterales bacterium]
MLPWNLVKLVVAVVVGASITSAALVSYGAEIRRANASRAAQLVAQIEGLKTKLSREIDFGERPSPTNGVELASQLLPNILLKGVPLTGRPETDAVTLGFSALSVGTLDTENPGGSVSTPGTPASVTLTDGTIVGGSNR